MGGHFFLLWNFNLFQMLNSFYKGQNSVFSLRLEDVSGVFDVEPKFVTGSSPVSIRIANGTLDYENPNQRKFIVLVSILQLPQNCRNEFEQNTKCDTRVTRFSIFSVTDNC